MKDRETRKAEFITRAREQHGIRYTYNSVHYVNARIPVAVICPEHGSWMVSPYAHAPPNKKRGTGCPKCAGHHRTKKDLIEQAKAVHGERYDYSKTVFLNSAEPFDVYCPEHDKYWTTTWHSHITVGHGCQKCGAERPFDLKAFLDRASTLHRGKYDYSQVTSWNGWHISIPIKCRIHEAVFWQRPSVHIHHQAGCPRCSAKARGLASRDRTSDFIRKATAIHGDSYNYSLTEYRADNEEVKVICRVHGVFSQRADHHKTGAGCASCHFESMKKERSFTFSDFLKLAEDLHLHRYEYDEDSWKGYRGKLRIRCPNHGWFLQTAMGHAQGSGCPSCQESRGEREVAHFLKKRSIFFERQKKFGGCVDIRSLPFDFYIPELDLLIEYDGEQHFLERETGIFTKEAIIGIKRRDKIKTDFCLKAGKKLVRIRFDQSVQDKLTLLFASLETPS